MVEIGGKPILWHIMKHYAHYGDSLADVNIDPLPFIKKGHGKLATLTATRPASTYILMNVPHSLSRSRNLR